MGTLGLTGHIRAERRVTVPGARPGALTLHGPFPVLSHLATAAVATSSGAAVEQLNTNAPRQPDLGLAAVCTPPVLLWSMAYPETCETQLHNPKGLGINTYGATWSHGMEIRSPSPCRLGSP